MDVRQSLEFSEWRVPPSINCPYAVPDPNVFRRAVGFAISIKGGLKVRNPNFVEQCRAAVDGKKTVVLIDVKGGDLSVAPAREGSGVLDVTDSQALRAAYELSQAGSETFDTQGADYRAPSIAATCRTSPRSGGRSWSGSTGSIRSRGNC